MKYGFGRLFCFVLFAPLLICRAAADESDPQALGSLKAAGVEKIVCVKRHTYNSNHYYTEYINSRWMPGGNLCILSPRDGSVKDLLPAMTNGVFERFDVSFDAKRIVFAWKCGSQDGYRIYEVNADGSGLRQLTFPQPDDAELVKKYRVDPNYHHGTDDMQPCYLADGGIAFISTRCQFGILCDSPDNFTTTVLYRMDADGKNMRRLSSSSVSEASPVMLPDGRIMYTRWEYFDKGAVSVKCLWAMRPDGTSSSDIYGNDIALPPTMIYGRSIPGMANGYVVMGTPHCPQNGVGTVIRLDMTKPIRTREPMTYMTPDVDIRAEPGFAFRAANGQWRNDGEGRGRLFKDPYPLSSREFLVAHKPEGVVWNQHSAYGIYLLNETGEVRPVYRDPEISCWLPYPLKPRKVPPVLASALNRELAAKNQAVCMIADVYHGLEEVPRGAAKYLRILEQIPRPWAAQRKNMDDCYDQQHKCISKDTHLALKVQHGIVPVEADGSAHFFVPAGGNISLQVLDENFMALQTERTYVDYMPGETRSCIGCHETPPTSVSGYTWNRKPLAFARAPSVAGPQPDGLAAAHPLHYPSDIQPIWDRQCISCHSATNRQGGLDLSDTHTTFFNASYESLLANNKAGRLLGKVIGENHPKTGNVDYLPAGSLGARTSVLVALLTKGKLKLTNPDADALVRKLSESHKEMNLAPEEILRVANWVDTNCQFYGTYWGYRNLKYRGDPDYRPAPTFATAISMTPPAH